jgi:hypothetical protein
MQVLTFIFSLIDSHNYIYAESDSDIQERYIMDRDVRDQIFLVAIPV